jgi:hypothetical protein
MHHANSKTIVAVSKKKAGNGKNALAPAALAHDGRNAFRRNRASSADTDIEMQPVLIRPAIRDHSSVFGPAERRLGRPPGGLRRLSLAIAMAPRETWVTELQVSWNLP